MISLLERFYDPISGRILCDGAALPKLCPRKYRRDIALVQQEPVLYQGSIRDNIAMGTERSCGRHTSATVPDPSDKPGLDAVPAKNRQTIREAIF